RVQRQICFAPAANANRLPACSFLTAFLRRLSRGRKRSWSCMRSWPCHLPQPTPTQIVKGTTSNLLLGPTTCDFSWSCVSSWSGLHVNMTDYCDSRLADPTVATPSLRNRSLACNASFVFG